MHLEPEDITYLEHMLVDRMIECETTQDRSSSFTNPVERAEVYQRAHEEMLIIRKIMEKLHPQPI